MTELDRRALLRKAGKAGIVAGTAVWVAPVVKPIDMAAARSTLHSSPPRTTVPPYESPPPSEDLPPAARHSDPEPTATGSLPFTGNEEARNTIIGLMALASGVGLIAANKVDPREDWDS